MASRTDAYVDTSAFVAFLDRSDTHHAAFVRLFGEAPRLFTSPLVIAEGHGWFLRRYDATLALRFLAFIEDLSVLEVRPVGPADLEDATKMLRRFSDQRLTLVDSVGLAWMQRARTRVCWSTDRHLALTGVKLVIHAR